MGGCFGNRPRGTHPLPVENRYQLFGVTKTQSFSILKQGFIQRIYISTISSYYKKMSEEDFINFFQHLEYSKVTLQSLFLIFPKQEMTEMSILQLQNGMEALVYESNQELYKILFWLYSEDIFKKVITDDRIKTFQLQNADCFKPNYPTIQQVKSDQKSGMYSFQSFQTWIKQSFISEKFRHKIIDKKIMQLQRQIIAYDSEVEQIQKIDRVQYLISTKWWQSLKLYLLARYQVRMNEISSNKETGKPQSGRLSTILANIPSNIIFLAKAEQEKINLGIIGKFSCKAGIDNRKIGGIFEGELKDNVCFQTDFIRASSKLYSLLFVLYGGGPEFKRHVRKGVIDLYPLFIRIFLFQNFQIIDQTCFACAYSKFQKFSEIQKHYRGNVFYLKQFGGNSWRKLHYSVDKTLYEIGLQSNVFLINMDEVNEKFFLRMHANDEVGQVQLKNPFYGNILMMKSLITKKKVCVTRITSNELILHSLSQTGPREYACLLTQIEHVLDICEFPQNISSKINGLMNNSNQSCANSVISALFFQPLMSMKFMVGEGIQTPILQQINQIATCHLSQQLANPKQLRSLLNIKSSGSQQNDAYKYMLELISKCEEEESSHKSSHKYLTKALGGSIKKQYQCMECSNTKQVTKQFRILSLPIPQQKYLTYQIYLKRCGANKKYQVKLHDSATILELQNAFQKQSLLKTQQYQLFQIQQGDISRHLYLYEKQLTLKEINLTTEDRICAYLKTTKNYQINIDPSTYSSIQLGDQQTICKIIKTTYNSCEVEYRDSNGITYKRTVQPTSLAKFPNLQNKRFLWIKILNRDYYDLSIVTDPTMVHIPDWCTVYDLQATIFKKYQKAILKQSSFLLRYLDPQLRCIVCHRYIRAVINQKQKFIISMFCKGKCIVDSSLPVLWFSGVIIAIDWVDSQALMKFNDFQPSQLVEQNTDMSIENCLKNNFSLRYSDKHCPKCDKITKNLDVKKISTLPKLLIIHLQRFKKQKKINSKITIQQDLQIKPYAILDSSFNGLYQLCAAVCHIGQINTGNYYSYVLENQVWMRYHDQIAKAEEFEKINHKEIYLLLYQMVH